MKRKVLMVAVAGATAAGIVLTPAGLTSNVRRVAAATQGASGACNNNKIVVTYYSEPSIMDFQQFGTDGDNDVRANLVGTLFGRKPVKGKYPNTTNGITGQYVGQLAKSWSLNRKAKTLPSICAPGCSSRTASADQRRREVLLPARPQGPAVLPALGHENAHDHEGSQITTPNKSTVVFHFRSSTRSPTS